MGSISRGTKCGSGAWLRLTEALYSGAVEASYSYDYDAVGNMTAYTETVGATSTTVTRTFNAANQLVTSDDSANTTTYTYDDNGNLTQVSSSGTQLNRTYTYNQRNWLVRVGFLPSKNDYVTYTYDGDGHRVQQDAYYPQSVIYHRVTRYTNDTAGLAQALVTTTSFNDNPPSVQTDNLFGLDLIHQDEGTQTRTLLADGLGSVRTEMVGSTIERITTYEPYGKLLAHSGVSGTTYGYTGEQYDGNVGLLYLRARYYNPYLNQFQSRDPFPGYARLPQSQNGYSYAHNNPINLMDLSGRVVEGPYASNALYTNSYQNSECCQFVKDVEYIINEGLSSGLPEWAIVGVLAQYYANINAIETFNIYISAPSPSLSGWGCSESTVIIPVTIAMPFPISRGTPVERHPIYNRAEYDPNAMQDYMNREADEMRAAYGFKRPYFQNTHHYFGAFILSYAYGSKLGTYFSGRYDERNLTEVKNSPNFPTPQNYDPTSQAHRDAVETYEALWLDVFTDFYVNETAAEHASIIHRQGIQFLPGLIEAEMCATSEAGVWSLQSEIYLSGNYEPHSGLAPWWERRLSAPMPP